MISMLYAALIFLIFLVVFLFFIFIILKIKEKKKNSEIEDNNKITDPIPATKNTTKVAKEYETKSSSIFEYISSNEKEIAKLKVQYALTGEMDQDSKYSEEAMIGYITGGAGNYTDKYIGEEYTLEGFEPEVEETDSSENNE